MNATAELNHIAAIDLDSIKAKLMEKDGEGWTQQRVDAVEREYRRFLCLAKLYPQEETAPLIDVDIFWHNHILDTLKYAADCQQMFGYFLHHSPQSGPRSEADEARHEVMGARMQELYRAAFDEAGSLQEPGHAVPQRSAAMLTEAGRYQYGTAYCQAIMARPASRQANTAYCQAIMATSASTQTESAYCQAIAATSASSQTGTAYCQVITASSTSSRRETAYCQTITSKSAPLRQGAAWPQSTAQNSNVYSRRPASAQAA